MAAPNFFRDDNGQTLVDPTGLRPSPVAAPTTLSGSVQEIALGGANMTTAGSGSNKYGILRVVAGAQGAYYAFGAAGASGFTTANMVMLPPNWVEYVKVNASDASAFVLQLGTAGTFQASWMI